MKKHLRILLAVVALGMAGAAVAASVTCPLHTYASCNNTYQMSASGTAYKWRCTCGDDVWVRR